MNLIHYRPITKDMTNWDFDSLLDRFFDNSPVYNQGYPQVDILEDENRYLIQADLPGYTEKDVDIKVDKDLLTLSSKERGEEKEKKEEKEANHLKYLTRERGEGKFCRSFSLPKNIERDAITAHVHNGVLTLELPKVPEAKPRTIEVRST
jgi:HSP20 family protein